MIGRNVTTPRTPDGRFLRRECDDPNCDGVLCPERSYGSPIWACNGLTHDTDTGPLRACDRSFERSPSNAELSKET